MGKEEKEKLDKLNITEKNSKDSEELIESDNVTRIPLSTPIIYKDKELKELVLDPDDLNASVLTQAQTLFKSRGNFVQVTPWADIEYCLIVIAKMNGIPVEKLANLTGVETQDAVTGVQHLLQ